MSKESLIMFTHKEIVYALLQLAFNRRRPLIPMHEHLVQQELMHDMNKRMEVKITEKGKAFVMDYLESMGCI